MATSDSTTYSIYRIVCFVTGKCYVGQSSCVKRRKTEHFRSLKGNRHYNEKLQSAYNKYGKQSFYHEVIEEDIDIEDANPREIHWIAYFDSYYNGYNLSLGGQLARPHSMKPCTWNGIVYSSITDAAEAQGVTIATMAARLRNGYTCDADVNERNLLHNVTWNGIEYPNLKAAADANDIGYKQMQYRFYKGYVSDDNLTFCRPCIWNGIEYESIHRAASANGINNSTMQERLNNGYSCDTDLVPKHSVRTVWNGIEYDTIKAAAEANNINRTTMRLRLLKGHKCDSDAVDLHQKKRKCIVDGIEYLSIADAARAIGVSAKALWKRLEKGKKSQPSNSA